MKPNLVIDRDEKDNNRKAAKQMWDRRISLTSKDKELLRSKAQTNVSDDGYHRLLDEGAVVFNDGSMRSYIKRGAIKKWYDGLDEDYVGTFNLGHSDFGSNPTLLGTWTKKDLRLVDLGKGRTAVDVKVNLDDDLYVVKDLKKSMNNHNYDIGISAEFYGDLDLDATRKYETAVFESIDLRDIGVVGTVGNVNSRGLKLKEEQNMNWKEKLKTLKVKYSNAESETEVENLTAEELSAFIEASATKDVEIAELKELFIAADARVIELENQLESTEADVETKTKAELAQYIRTSTVSGIKKELQNSANKKEKLVNVEGLGVL